MDKALQKHPGDETGCGRLSEAIDNLDVERGEKVVIRTLIDEFLTKPIQARALEDMIKNIMSKKGNDIKRRHG